MKPSNRLSIVLLLSAAFLLIATIFSCKSIRWNYIGLEVPESSLIPLKAGGPHETSWQSEDVALQFEYSVATNRLKIKGAVDFSDGLKGFTHLDYFYLWIHFIGTDNRIIANQEISPLLAFSNIANTPFATFVPLPANAKAFVFSYSGLASEGGGGDNVNGDGGATWNFWKTPHG